MIQGMIQGMMQGMMMMVMMMMMMMMMMRRWAPNPGAALPTRDNDGGRGVLPRRRADGIAMQWHRNAIAWHAMARHRIA